MLLSFQARNFQSLRRKNIFVTAIISGALIVFGAINLKAQSFSENFDVVPVPGWTTQNNSVPTGSTGWFQGNTTQFSAQSGAANSYIAADFNNTTGNNTISNWLISPQRTFTNGDVITFWTRQPSSSGFADRLQVRLSLAGASTNVGTGAAAVGDFTTLLLDINPTYQTFGYPFIWTSYTIVLSGISAPTNGRIAFRYFVENGGPSGSRSLYIGIDTFTYTSAADIVPSLAVSDYNGDGKTDLALVRNVGGGAGGQTRWFVNLSGTTTTYNLDWGITSDTFVPADYDGDGKTDIAVWRGGASGAAAFYILQSQTGTFRIETFGQSGDDPTVVDDYDGDGKADPAVYRAGESSQVPQSTWYFRGSLNNPSGNVTYVSWGQFGDFVAPGDYDGDGKADFVVQRSDNFTSFARFWMLQTADGFKTIRFGFTTDSIVPGDYDGDGKTDLAIIRSASGLFQWYYLRSSNGSFSQATFGVSATDFPVPGDYDGDGRTDFAVWRPSATSGASKYWIYGTTYGAFSIPFGSQGDYPPGNFNVH